jgi:hypothetical protein
MTTDIRRALVPDPPRPGTAPRRCIACYRGPDGTTYALYQLRPSPDPDAPSYVLHVRRGGRRRGRLTFPLGHRSAFACYHRLRAGLAADDAATLRTGVVPTSIYRGDDD